MTDLVQAAHDFVEGLIPAPLAGSIRIATTLGELLEMLAETERRAEGVRVRLNFLISIGAATDGDQLVYNRLRRALYRAQIELYNEVVDKLPGPAADQVPAPKLMPALGVPLVPVIGGRLGGGRSLGRLGLGTPAAAAAPAAPFAMAPWMWAVAALAVLVALGLMAVIAIAIATSAAAAATVGIAHRYAELAEQSTAAREAAYRDCLARGVDPSECAAIARTLVPTPAEQLPDIPNPLDGMASTFKWGAIGLGLAIAGYFSWYFLSNRKQKEEAAP